MNDLPPVPPVVDPAPTKHPRLTEGQAHAITGVAIIALMAAAGFLNQLSAGILTVPPQYAPLVQFGMVPLTMLVLYLLRGLRTGDWTAPTTAHPGATFEDNHDASTDDSPAWLRISVR